MARCSLLKLLLLPLLIHLSNAKYDFSDALEKSILFFEAMRSGPLPSSQRVKWRGPSGLTDGKDSKVDLVGGYYDAGDNVKFLLPGAFSITLLSWAIVEAGTELSRVGQLGYALEAVRWGTDFFLKSYVPPTTLYVQVGNANADHSCWQRPEDMDTPRTSYKVDAQRPGSEPAAETAAALAAASMAFQATDRTYSGQLLTAAKGLFDFANKYRGSYSDTLGDVVTPFYKSFSGYKDELLWAAAWLYKATRDKVYLEYVVTNAATFGGTSPVSTGLTWDNKLTGVQVLMSRLFFSGNSALAGYKAAADSYFCSILPGNSQGTYTAGGLLYVQPATNLQYTASSAFMAQIYAKYRESGNFSSATCGGGTGLTPADLRAFARKQVEYILGSNPSDMSYMVGFGTNYPRFIHQRSSSLPSISTHPQHIGCTEGFRWLTSTKPNPNILVGAVVGGPGKDDKFSNQRNDYAQTEPALYVNAAVVGALAMLV